MYLKFDVHVTRDMTPHLKMDNIVVKYFFVYC